MTKLSATFAEAAMIDTVAHWFDLAIALLQTENSQLHVQTWLKRLVRQGTIDAVRVIEWANRGSADADIALRQVASEMLDSGETPPKSITGYAVLALNKPPVARRKGGDAVDDLLRNQAISVIVSKAVEHWHPHLPLSRSHHSKALKQSPSACSIVSTALAKHRINVGERRVEKIFNEFADLLPAHRAWQASLVSASNRAL
jgi:hypothetical protein